MQDSIKLRIVLLSFVCAICVACAHSQTTYTQDGVRIVLPVRQERDQKGALVEKLFNDGGTKMIRFVDAQGELFEVYIDHRIGNEESWGSVYLRDYPGSSNSVRVANQGEFKNVVLKGVKY
jgi:hypothetical protein